MANEIEIAKKRRRYVNDKFGKLTRNKSLTQKQKTKLFKRLWKRAKHKY